MRNLDAERALRLKRKTLPGDLVAGTLSFALTPLRTEGWEWAVPSLSFFSILANLLLLCTESPGFEELGRRESTEADKGDSTW